MRRRLALLLLGPLLSAVLSGCTSDEPDADVPSDAFEQPSPASFRPGFCSDAAEAVLAAGQDLHVLGPGPTVPPEPLEDLKQAQAALAALLPSSDPAAAAVKALVVSAGLVRLRADGNTYDPSLGDAALADYRAVVAACTAAS